MSARRFVKPQVTQLVVILLSLILSGAVMAQTPLPTSTPPPGTALTPVPVLIVTPAAAPTPVSPWPETVQRVWETLRALWAAFGWWAIPVLLFAVLVFWFVKPYLEKAREKLMEWVAKKTVEEPLKKVEEKAALNEATREYLKAAVSEKYRFLDLKAIDPEMYKAEVRLREVYIPLRAKGGFQAERAVGQERDEVWAREKDMTPTLIEHLARFPRLVILGRAGSGKSTFLQYTASILADALLYGWPRQVPEELATLRDAFDPPPLPICFPLRDFVPFWEHTLKPEEKTLACQGEALLRFLEKNFERYGLERKFFKERLYEGRPGRG